ncbi:MAG: branched-chain amino acid ABC transporter permease [Firmicutes bacterium]|nr:branched-chain amino acid ABC transporter permease [Bacillota bacterium]
MRAGGRWWAVALAVAVVAWAVAVPRLGLGQLALWEDVAIQVLFATSVNLLLGYANIPSFGQAAFYGAGAYTVALLAQSAWPPLAALAAAVAVAAALAFVTGLITSRVTGLAFSMVTLAIGQVLYTFVLQSNAAGGEGGISGVAPPARGLFDLTQPVHLWWFILLCVAVAMLALWWVVSSPFGRALTAIREDPKRAAFLGIAVRRYRVMAFTIAGGAAGLAGGLYAYSTTIVAPAVLNWTQSASPIMMALVGGMHTFLGPALGAVLITWLLYVLGQATRAYLLYVGVVLLAFVLLVPRGIVSIPDLLRRLAGGRRATGAAPEVTP